MGDPRHGGSKPHVCIVNVGLYRSGTTTLVEAAKRLGLKGYREFPSSLSQVQQKDFLFQPEKAILDWSSSGGLDEVLATAARHDILCDGWFALLPFLPRHLSPVPPPQPSSPIIFLPVHGSFHSVMCSPVLPPLPPVHLLFSCQFMLHLFQFSVVCITLHCSLHNIKPFNIYHLVIYELLKERMKVLGKWSDFRIVQRYGDYQLLERTPK